MIGERYGVLRRNGCIEVVPNQKQGLSLGTALVMAQRLAGWRPDGVQPYEVLPIGEARS